MKANIDYLDRMKELCEEIFRRHERFGNSLENYENDGVYRDAVNMCIFQIGELSAKLSNDFKEAFNEVDWRKIKAFRNFLAHEYDMLDYSIAYKISTDDIQDLYQYILSILEEE